MNPHAQRRRAPRSGSTEPRLAQADGFTLVEVMVAGVLLVVGMLGVLSLLSGALRTTTSNSERVGATNLARELIEATRGLDYEDMTGTLVPTRLQARGMGAGPEWTIERRGVRYAISGTSCVYDSPVDGLAATPSADVCTPQPAGAGGDANGDDFRRTTFQIAWEGANGARPIRQTTLVVNPSGGLGPRISGVTPVTQTITSDVSEASVVWTTSPADVLRWAVDDGHSAGTVTGSTSFQTQWPIGHVGDADAVLDGSYQITGQPFDDRNIAGEAKRANIVLNRRRPYPPPSLDGGHNTREDDWVELEWAANRERDVLGYRVSWAGPDQSVGGGDDVQVCPALAADPMLEPATRSCIDTSPPAGEAKYYVAALDRDPDNELRTGDPRSLSIDAPSPRPAAPLGLVAATVGDRPRLVWLPPLLSNVSFYRIYRDGNRYDRIPGSSLIYVDESPERDDHYYAVTAVDSTYNESDFLGPVLWLR